jgi:hypothetical protein
VEAGLKDLHDEKTNNDKKLQFSSDVQSWDVFPGHPSHPDSDQLLHRASQEQRGLPQGV